jgi:hypothetical protein
MTRRRRAPRSKHRSSLPSVPDSEGPSLYLMVLLRRWRTTVDKIWNSIASTPNHRYRDTSNITLREDRERLVVASRCDRKIGGKPGRIDNG